MRAERSAWTLLSVDDAVDFLRTRRPLGTLGVDGLDDMVGNDEIIVMQTSSGRL